MGRPVSHCFRYHRFVALLHFVCIIVFLRHLLEAPSPSTKAERFMTASMPLSLSW